MAAIDLLVHGLCGQHSKRVLDVGQQKLLVLFHCQNVVGLLVDDRLGGYLNQTTYTNFSFNIGGVTYPLGAQQVVAQGFVSNSCPNFTQPSSVPITLPNAAEPCLCVGSQ